MSERGRNEGRWPIAMAVGALGLGVALGLQAESFGAKEPITRTGRRTAPQTAGSQEGQESEYAADLKRLEAKVDQLLANQEEILKRFDAVMEELRIVKIRATLR